MRSSGLAGRNLNPKASFFIGDRKGHRGEEVM